MLHLELCFNNSFSFLIKALTFYNNQILFKFFYSNINRGGFDYENFLQKMLGLNKISVLSNSLPKFYLC